MHAHCGTVQTAGRVLLAWAAKYVLRGEDTVFVTYVTPSRQRDGRDREGQQHSGGGGLPRAHLCPAVTFALQAFGI